jgi:dihydrofolate reductase
MGRVVYSMMVSLDGFVETPDRSLDWVIIDEELHRFANAQVDEAVVDVYGRGMWETMSAYWPTADQNPGEPPVQVEFAKIWQAMPKVVVSRSLKTVEGPNVRLFREDGVEVVRRLAAEHDGEVAVGGATLAASLIRADLVDEYRLFTHPVAIGAGTPYLPPGTPRQSLELVDSHDFGTGVTYRAYRRRRDADGGPEPA